MSSRTPSLVVGLLCLLLAACPSPPPEPTAEIDLCSSSLSPEEKARAIEEIRGWLDARELPADVDSTEECDFYTFAWREFLALAREENGARVFEGWGNLDDLLGSSPPPPWPEDGEPRTLRMRQMTKSWGEPVVAEGETQAASLVPLVDQDSQLVHYAVLVDRTEYDFIRCCGLYERGCFNSGVEATELARLKAGLDPPPESTFLLPPFEAEGSRGAAIEDDTVELKTAWKAMSDGESGFITVDGIVRSWYDPDSDTWSHDPREEELGLVGMHVIAKTPENPAYVWSTFEHRKNAPDCGADASGDWTFHSTDCEATCSEHWPAASCKAYCMENAFCSSCPIPFSEWKIEVDQVLNSLDSKARNALCKEAFPDVETCDDLSVQQFQQLKRQHAEATLEGLIEKAKSGSGNAVLAVDGGPATGDDAQDGLVCTQSPGDFKQLKTALFDSRRECGRPIPTQVCRTAYKDSDSKVIPRTPPKAAALNALVEEALGDSVLANYRLVGSLYVEGEGDQAKKLGALGLSNVTMETFEQPINCLTCHGLKPQFNPSPYPFKPIAAGINDRSFFGQRVKLPGTFPQCNRVPDSCTAHGWDPEKVCQLPAVSQN